MPITREKRIKVKPYHRKNGVSVRGFSYKKSVKVPTKKRHGKLVFCPDCGSLLKVLKKDNGYTLICPRDGSEYEPNSSLTISKIRHDIDKEKTIIMNTNNQELYDAKAYCEKCGFIVPVKTWQVQLRSSDEPSTHFYRCEKGHTWREE